MDWSCSIRLVNERGRPLVDYKVNGIFSNLGNPQARGRTDADGWVRLELNTSKGSVYAEVIFVTLSTFPSMITKTLIEDEYVEGGTEMSFTIPSDDWD